MTTSIVLVGCGNMGFAMLKGWLDEFDVLDVHVVEPNDELRERVEGTGVSTHVDASGLPDGLAPDLVILAVKPQIMAGALSAYRHWIGGKTTFLSVAAGITISTLAAGLDGATPIVRCMPNTPSAIGKGMMVCNGNAHVSTSIVDLATRLLSSSGDVLWIDDENLMDAVTAVSGSGPAYLFHFIESMSGAAKAAGLPDDIADALALQTVYGAACLAKNSSHDPGTLRQQVTSPGGTTAAALEVFMGDKRLEKLVTEAVTAAKSRSIELGKTK